MKPIIHYSASDIRYWRHRLGLPIVVSVYGMPGAGKTTLLKKLEVLGAEKPNVVVGYTNLYDNMTDILRRREVSYDMRLIDIERKTIWHTIELLAQNLSNEQDKMSTTLDLITLREKLAAEIIADTSLNSELIRTVGSELAPRVLDALAFGLGFFTSSHIQKLVSSTLDLAKEQVQPALEIIANLRNRQKNEETRMLAFKPVDMLTRAFIEDIRNLSQSYQFVFLIDDLKPTRTEINTWLRAFIQQVNKSNITWVLASWTGFTRNWDDLGSKLDTVELHCIELGNDTFKENLRPKTREHIKQTLHSFAEINSNDECFLPLLIQEVIKHPASTSDASCCNQLATRAKNWLADDTLFEQFCRCAIARRINSNIFDLLVETPKYTFERLLSEGVNSFIYLEDEYRFEPQIRYALLRYTQIRDSMSMYRKLHTMMAKYYEDKLGKNFQPDNFQILFFRRGDDSNRLNFIEWFYHSLATVETSELALLNGLQYAVFEIDAREYINPLIDSILQVTREVGGSYSSIFHQSEARRRRRVQTHQDTVKGKRLRTWGETLDECADLLVTETNNVNVDWEPIIGFCDDFLEINDDRVSEEAKAEAHFRLGEAYGKQGDIQKAKNCFQKVVEMATQRESGWCDDIGKFATEELSVLLQDGDI